MAASSASYDLHSKLREYQKAGVLEYVVWRVWDQAIDWFVRGDNEFAKIDLENGVYRSRIFPGLWLDAAALIAGDMQCVLVRPAAGPEHVGACRILRIPAGKIARSLMFAAAAHSTFIYPLPAIYPACPSAREALSPIERSQCKWRKSLLIGPHRCRGVS